MAEGRSGRLAGGRDARGEEPGDDRNPGSRLSSRRASWGTGAGSTGTSSRKSRRGRRTKTRCSRPILCLQRGLNSACG